MSKFNDGDIIEYGYRTATRDGTGFNPSGDFYTVINNGTSITGARDNDYTSDGYELDLHEHHFRLVEPAPVPEPEWIPATLEDMGVLDKFGIEYDIQETISIRIKGGK